MQHNDPCRECERLDVWHARLVRDPARAHVESIVRGLERMRSALDADAWQELVRGVIHPHPLLQRLHECPYCERAWTKPRGYAGDPALFDYLYFGARSDYVHDRAVTPLGRAVFSAAVGCGAGQSVRERRQRIADAVDATAQERPGARVLAVASGFLREASLSKSLVEGRIDRWTCIDEDAASIRGLLPIVERFPEVDPIRGSVLQLLDGDLDLDGSFDLCYAAGLLESLDADVARSLIRRLLRLLVPGGRLLLANFAAAMPERAFLEAIGDWWLLYRTEQQMESLLRDVRAGEIARASVYRDDANRTLYLDVRRA